MGAGLFALSAMAVSGREVSAELDTFELMLYRSLIGLPVVLGIAWALGGLRTLPTQRPGLHLLRNLLHFSAQNLWFHALAIIPLAQVFALEFTTPIWVILLAPLVLREPITRSGALAALLGFLGILVIVRPGVTALLPAHGAALLAAIGFAGNVLVTKQLSATQSTLCILFWMTLMQAVMALLCALPGGLVLPSMALAPWLLVLGLCGIAAHFCITQALRCAPATVVAPMDFLRLPLIAVVGMLLYGEPLEAAVFAGGALIVLGNLVNIRGQRSAGA
ncbi:MAG: DMT family transporter [Pseudomonadales bacterium]|jgi:drug/metabolite transporter (DMT)-like permease|nr:DMT family transporter [Pseudomonadales bacterium]